MRTVLDHVAAAFDIRNNEIVIFNIVTKEQLRKLDMIAYSNGQLERELDILEHVEASLCAMPKTNLWC
jgi:hypothetical protein